MGVFAAGPYLTQKPYPADIHQQVADLASQGSIDPVAELGGDRVYIWHGSLDTIVPVCECLLELETKVHPKIRNHGEGPY